MQNTLQTDDGVQRWQSNGFLEKRLFRVVQPERLVNYVRLVFNPDGEYRNRFVFLRLKPNLNKNNGEEAGYGQAMGCPPFN